MSDLLGPNGITRRRMLSAASIGLIGAMAPAALAQTSTTPFRFLVVNDLHHASAECDPFFARLVAQMQSHGRLSCCLIVGDIADAGRRESFIAVRNAFRRLDAPVYAVPGNHDCDVGQNTKVYEGVFPGRLNYTANHGGWQFIGLDTTEGNKAEATHVSDVTLSWLDATVRRLDRRRPTVVFTHFPLSADVPLAPLDAGAVLERLAPLDVRAVFTGHYHARLERTAGPVTLVTNACCSRVRDNHDDSLEEGYIVCTAYPDGRLTREFVEFAPARKATAAARGISREVRA